MNDIHQRFNRININKLDNTYKNRKKYIDTIATLDNIMSFAEGCTLCKTNEIIDTDHRRHIVDIDLNAYFDEDFSM